MFSAFLYFLLAMVFITVVVFYLWNTDRLTVSLKTAETKPDDTLLPEPATLQPQIDAEKCIGCGQCIDACPENGVLAVKGHKVILADYTRCLGHGACFQICPFDAITLAAGRERRGEELPHLYENFESAMQGIFIAGELGGMGLLRNASEQAILAVDNIVRSLKDNRKADYDLVIVGAGTAGLSAALNARKNNLRFIVLEQDTIELSILNYPRKKVSGVTTLDLPIAGKVTLKHSSKRQLADLWYELIMKFRIPVQENCMVQSIIRLNDYFNIISSDNQNFTTTFVLLAIGRRGSPVKLNIQGENLEKVAYRLPDSDCISGKKVIITGCGNTTAESALMLSEKNQVTIVCQKAYFDRLTPLNNKSIEKAMLRGRINVFFRADLKSIEEKTVTIISDSETIKINNDLVYIFAGGESTAEFLDRTGVCIEAVYSEELIYQ